MILTSENTFRHAEMDSVVSYLIKKKATEPSLFVELNEYSSHFVRIMQYFDDVVFVILLGRKEVDDLSPLIILLPFRKLMSALG
ncbi:hypothetical protein OUZ56_024096 [Daphnia magna]|uniref:Uncharacterized protein n=1 Tax=Daphnia magna TaxID=35525 RepID=A0ABR0B046_9CRUS|nr:hypothetical protein OUZ56_024096 [Daphnia magna]